MRTIPLLLFLVLWLILGYFYYNTSQHCCDTGATSEATEKVAETATTAAVAAITNEAGPLMFRWSDASTITGDGWDAMRKQLIDGLGDNQVLEITGLYRVNEVNNTSFENLGVARANETAKLFIPPLTKEQLRLVGKQITGEVDQTNPFVSTAFKNQVNTANVKEIDDKTIIRFPFNSNRKLNSREIENYLNDVADRVKKTGENVRLTGHTDDIGSDASNVKLGQRRADIIRSYLIQRGVAPSKITATSQGESSPITTNATPAGRADNRRTELQIIK